MENKQRINIQQNSLSKEIFLIIGATGNQGGAVTRHLLKHIQTSDFTIRALVRNPKSKAALELEKEGVALVKGSIENAEAMSKALVDVTRMFFHTVHHVFNGEKWELEAERGFAALKEIEKAASLKHIIYSTLPMLEGYQESFGKVSIEEEIRKMDLPLTTVLAPFYLENFIDIWPPMRKWFGLFGPLEWGWLPSQKELKMPHGSVEDFGAVVANILLLPVEGYLNRKVTILSEDVLLSDVLKNLGAGINKTINWKPLSTAVFKNLPFPKEAIDGLIFYADNLSNHKKVEEAFLATKGISVNSLTEACEESHRIYSEMLSIEDWALKNKHKIGNRSLKSFIYSLSILWAKLKSKFAKKIDI